MKIGFDLSGLEMSIDFPWGDRWLKGSEYEFMIKNHEEYLAQGNLRIYFEHPLDIYTSPAHGMIYFLRNQSLKELGFPRVKGLKKRFKWKKMNFVTPLPKQNPKVTYLVATGKLGQSCYRMHIVYCESSFPILCHLLKIQNSFKVGIGIVQRQQSNENSEPDKIDHSELCTSENLEIRENFVSQHHPLEIEALLYKIAPFRRYLEPQRGNHEILN